MNDEGRYNVDDYTIEDYLLAQVNLNVSSSLVIPILLRRGVAPDSLLKEVDDKLKDLTLADFYVKIATTTPDRIGAVTDTDNGWTHSDGGYTISKTYREWLLKQANAIYAEYDEPLVGARNAFKMRSHGVQRARIGMNGEPLPHVID